MLLRHDFQQMPVVDHRGQLVGIPLPVDIQTAASGGLMHQIEQLSHEGTTEGLQAVKVAQIELAQALLPTTSRPRKSNGC